MELAGLIDDELPVIADEDGPALEGARGGAFKVDAGNVEARAVVGALEFLLAVEPVGGAAEVGAGGAEGVDPPFVADDPGVLVLEALDDLALLVAVREADLELARRLG